MADKRRYWIGSRGPFRYDQDKGYRAFTAEGRIALTDPGTSASIELEHHNYQVTDGSQAALPDHINVAQVKTVIEIVTQGSYARYLIEESSGSVNLLEDPSGVWGATSGASDYNIYYNSGDSTFYLENNDGSGVTSQFWMFEKTFTA